MDSVKEPLQLMFLYVFLVNSNRNQKFTTTITVFLL